MTGREDKKSYSDEDIRIICLLTNTADYCWTTIAQLEEKLIEKIKEEYKAQVKMTDERDICVRFPFTFKLLREADFIVLRVPESNYLSRPAI